MSEGVPPRGGGARAGVDHLCGLPVHHLDEVGVSPLLLHQLTVNPLLTDFPVFQQNDLVAKLQILRSQKK